jgi:aminopeptidase N
VFWGAVNITLRVTRPTDHLVVHAANSLTVSGVQMTGADGQPIEIAAVWRYPPNGYLVLNFSQTLQPQYIATLSMTFQAVLSPMPPYSGLYLASYMNGTGARVPLATTQFEAADARKAFPCFDEPSFKAQFTISVHAASRYPTVLSNMPVTSTTPSPVRDGWLLTRFEPTVVMSSYLVALVVCDFQYTQVTSQCGSKVIPSRVYAPLHRLNATVHPARMAAVMISHYCTYFQAEYPLPKEDHIYIPQFAAGAMENWGLITSHTHTRTHCHDPSTAVHPVRGPAHLSSVLCSYSRYADTALLWDPTINNIAQLQRVAVVIAHELAHQWFGQAPATNSRTCGCLHAHTSCTANTSPPSLPLLQATWRPPRGGHSCG